MQTNNILVRRFIEEVLNRGNIDSVGEFFWVDMVEQIRELDEREEKQIFGEALPPGLKLINNN